MRSEGKKRTLELSLIQEFSKIEKLFGGATRNRTGDTRIFSPLLSSASKGFAFVSNQLSHGTLAILQLPVTIYIFHLVDLMVEL